MVHTDPTMYATDNIYQHQNNELHETQPEP